MNLKPISGRHRPPDAVIKKPGKSNWHFQLVLRYTVLAIFITTLTGSILYLNARNQLLTNAQVRLKAIASLAAMQLGGQDPAILTGGVDDASPVSRGIQGFLREILKANPDTAALYTLTRNASGQVVYGLLLTNDPAYGYQSGDLYVDPGPLLKENITNPLMAFAENNFRNDQRDSWLSAYAPLPAPDGTWQGLVGVDLAASQLINAERRLLTLFLALFLGTVPVAVGIGWLFSRRTIATLEQITQGTEQIARGDLNQLVIVRSQDPFARLAIALNSITHQLKEKSNGFVLHIDDRLRELERQAHYSTASFDILHTISNSLAPSQVAKQAVELIRERFDLYYVGLYLSDETGEWGILQAGTGDAGQALLASGHRVRVGEGAVGKSIAGGSVQVVNTADMEAIHRWISELPESGSEASLPLRTQGKVIGALNLHSDSPNGFNEDQLYAIQRTADFIANAIENANLYNESQETLKITRRAYDELSRRSWNKVVRNRPNWGYYCDEMGVTSLDTYQSNPQPTNIELPVLHLPIVLRGQVIGDYEAHKPEESGDWHPDEISLMNTMMTQLEAALESARLFQDAQERAAREQITHEITDRLHRATSIDDLMKVLVLDIAKSLGASESFVQLSIPTRLKKNGQKPSGDEHDDKVKEGLLPAMIIPASEEQTHE